MGLLTLCMLDISNIKYTIAGSGIKVNHSINLNSLKIWLDSIVAMSGAS